MLCIWEFEVDIAPQFPLWSNATGLWNLKYKQKSRGPTENKYGNFHNKDKTVSDRTVFVMGITNMEKTFFILRRGPGLEREMNVHGNSFGFDLIQMESLRIYIHKILILWYHLGFYDILPYGGPWKQN